MGWGIPSFSDVKNAVTSTVSDAGHALSGAAGSVRDFSASAIGRAEQLAGDGVDLGRRAVNAASHVDVRQAASFLREEIGKGTEAARSGIRTGVEWAGQETHQAADFARAHVPGGDNPLSNAVRGAITVEENTTRFGLGVVGGVSREVIGFAGTVGELGVTAAEAELSPEAAAEYGQKIVTGAGHALEATGRYAGRVASDPSRLGGDVAGLASQGKDAAVGQLHRYEQAIRDGHGPETIGMDVGAVATYVVPVGGGPIRGALTAAARGGTEAAVRGGAELAARGGAETLARTGTEPVARDGAEATARTTTSAAARDGAASGAREAAPVTEAFSAADRAKVAAAQADQTRWGYAADEWGVTDLEAGDCVFGGLPGQSAYYTDRASVAAADGSRSSLFRSLQVKAHPEFGYRPTIGEYEVISDARVPAGKVAANPALGPGGANQLFIDDFKSNLRLVREIPLGE